MSSPFSREPQVGVPKIRSNVARQWDAVGNNVSGAGHSVATDLLRQRYEVYLQRKEYMGDMGDFRESVEIMTKLDGGTGRVLKDIG